MERLRIEPRPNWTKEVETLGFDFYKQDGVPYWGEDACYRFTAAEVDIIEEAANKLHKLCLYAVQRIVDMRLFPLLGIDPEIGRLITESWERREPAVYGRFDLIYDGTAPPKLLEYNADTPTALFEASIVQWNWREQCFPKTDQFNSIHESLVARWRSFLVGRRNADRLHVTCATPMPEDETTVQYIGATAQEAGYRVKFLPIQEVGWDEGLKRFVDLDGEPIQTLFKLYPWEWIMREDFGANVKPSGALFLEPIWKMLLSNKGLLPILWDMFPEHENLLPAYRELEPLGQPRRRPQAAARARGSQYQHYRGRQDARRDSRHLRRQRLHLPGICPTRLLRRSLRKYRGVDASRCLLRNGDPGGSIPGDQQQVALCTALFRVTVRVRARSGGPGRNGRSCRRGISGPVAP